MSRVGWANGLIVCPRGHATVKLVFYGYPGRRVVGYDNERGKGDHRHLEEREEAYSFSTVEILVLDFLSDVRRVRGET